MNGNADIGGDAERFGRVAIRPVFRHFVAEKAVAVDGAFAQGVAPGHAQPFGDLHLFAVTGIKNVLQTRVNIDFRQIGRFHIGNNLQHLQELTHQAFKRLFSGEGF
ncbi:hypothetical protein D3C76_1560140 [compost metagenome]